MNEDSSIHILLITDDSACFSSVTEHLDDSSRYDIVRVNTLQDGLKFSLDRFGTILLDIEVLYLENSDSSLKKNVVRYLTKMYTTYPRIPIVTLVEDEETGLDSLRYGAEDYIIRGEFNELVSTVRKAILRSRADLKVEGSSHVESKYFNVKVLKEYEQGLSEIIDFLPDATFVIDKFGRVMAWNKAIEKMTGVNADEMLGKGNHTYSLPFYGDRRPMLIDMVLNYDNEIEKSYKFLRRKNGHLVAEKEVHLMGKNRILWIKAVRLYDNQRKVTGAIASLRDVTEPRRSAAEVERALKEKNTLLKEIHHRVKNNLQIVSSLLGLQERYVEDDNKALDVLRESKNRIFSMSMVHEMLYQSKNIGSIEFSSYIRRLTTNLYYTYKKPNTPVPVVDAENISLNIDTSIPLGLIISELVSNSLKYAFPDDETGEIVVKLHGYNSEYELIIRDDGVGFPDDLDYKNTSSLGLILVNSLVNQIDGTMELDRSHGTKFIIRFRELNYSNRV